MPPSVCNKLNVQTVQSVPLYTFFEIMRLFKMSIFYPKIGFLSGLSGGSKIAQFPIFFFFKIGVLPVLWDFFVSCFQQNPLDFFRNKSFCEHSLLLSVFCIMRLAGDIFCERKITKIFRNCFFNILFFERF